MQDIQEKIKEFQRIREVEGEEAFQKAVNDYAKDVLENQGPGAVQGMMETFFSEFQTKQAEYEEKAKKNAAQTDSRPTGTPPIPPMDEGFLKAVQQSMPALKSQAQFNVFMSAFEALRGVMQSIFVGNLAAAERFKEVLSQSFEAAEKATELTEKLQEVPEAATSKLSQEYKEPPRQFTEYDAQRQLMTELEAIQSLQELTSWWNQNRRRIDEVRSPMLRNPLIDAVRSKKSTLEG